MPCSIYGRLSSYSLTLFCFFILPLLSFSCLLHSFCVALSPGTFAARHSTFSVCLSASMSVCLHVCTCVGHPSIGLPACLAACVAYMPQSVRRISPAACVCVCVCVYVYAPASPTVSLSLPVLLCTYPTCVFPPTCAIFSPLLRTRKPYCYFKKCCLEEPEYITFINTNKCTH